MNRGSTAPTPIHSTGSPGFNEAPIHESGKFSRTYDEINPKKASMRPRFMNRGSGNKLTPKSGAYKLQ